MLKRVLRITFFLIALTLPTLTLAQTDDIRIDFPPPSFVVSGTVEIFGAVDVPTLQSYLLEVTDETGADATWTPITLPVLQAPDDGILGAWDTTRVTNGVYRLRVRAILTDGSAVTSEIDGLRVENEAVRPLAFITNTPRPLRTPTPVPTPEPPRIVPRPVVDNPLPVPVGGQMDSMDDDAADLMSAAGMTWIKWQIPYTIGDASLLDVARDRINFSHERGFFAFLSIKGDKFELAAVGAEEYYPLFAEFVGQIAALQPDAIQIWNEMNLDREWPEGEISPQSYVRLLSQSYEAIKAVDPLVRVVTGAPAPTGAESFFGTDKVWNDDRYYLGMANAGAGQVSDCVGIHYNEGILPPSAQGGDPRDEYPTRYFQQMIQRAAYPFTLNGRTGEPLCFSELGYLSPDGYGRLPDGFAWGANTSVAEQSAWLRDAIQLASQSATQVDLIIVFNVNYSRFVDNDPQGGFAIIRPDGTCPACDAIAELRTS